MWTTRNAAMHAVKCSALAVAVAVSTHAGAALVDLGTVTADTESDLDWLDLTVTQGLSYNAVAAGPLIALGWRIATLAEVQGLFGRYVGPTSPTYIPTAYDDAVAVARLLGVTYSWNNSEGALSAFGPQEATGIMSGGRFNDGTAFPYVGIGQVVALSSNGSLSNVQSWLARVDQSPPDQDSAIPAYGTFLVRATAEVPEPSGLALGALGALALLRSVRVRSRSSRS